MPAAQYQGVMTQLNGHYGMLQEGSPINTQVTRALLSNLNPGVNPSGSQGLISELERVVDRDY